MQQKELNNGIELEMDFQLSENLDMFLNFGLLKTEIKKLEISTRN